MTKKILNDNLNFTINIKWLIQLIIGVGCIVWGFYTIESRIQSLEHNMELTLREIEIYELERKESQKEHVDEIKEQLLWYQNEINLNPFSWGKSDKGK